MWAASWGKGNPMSTGTGWLPQIGTTSDCNRHGIYGPSYQLVWEMESQIKGAGNGVQYGLDCPGDATYYLCGYNSDNSPASNLTISPGDQINAAVAFLGPYTRGRYVRTFEIRLTDLTTGHYAQGHIKTDQSVERYQIAAQGGTILENEPGCRSVIPCIVPTNNGLAEFATPVQVSNMHTLTPTIVPLNYNEWVMQLGNGNQLAENSARTGSARGDKPGMSYSMSWLRRY
jgi:hypothetical protein